MPRKPQAQVENAIREVIEMERPRTQAGIQEALKSRGWDLNQSSISRILKKLRVVRAVNEEGISAYQIPSDLPVPIDLENMPLANCVREVNANEALIVLRTDPGSASYVARVLDSRFSEFLLGTVAGDDTIFVAPRSVTKIQEISKNIRQLFGLA